MSSEMIHIQPTRGRRTAFARWATAQTPKLRTVGINTFAVPAELFVQAPEDVLIGALVDGRRYVSPEEDAAEGTAPPGELLGVATAEGFSSPELTAIPGEPLPDVPEEAYGPDSTPLPPPTPDDPPAEHVDGVFPCSRCDREFTTERGRDTHRRHKHTEA
ncbi:hypothetical protein ACFYNV_29795 [Streptomyces albidoflavus]